MFIFFKTLIIDKVTSLVITAAIAIGLVPAPNSPKQPPPSVQPEASVEIKKEEAKLTPEPKVEIQKILDQRNKQIEVLQKQIDEYKNSILRKQKTRN